MHEPSKLFTPMPLAHTNLRPVACCHRLVLLSLLSTVAAVEPPPNLGWVPSDRAAVWYDGQVSLAHEALPSDVPLTVRRASGDPDWSLRTLEPVLRRLDRNDHSALRPWWVENDVLLRDAPLPQDAPKSSRAYFLVDLSSLPPNASNLTLGGASITLLHSPNPDIRWVVSPPPAAGPWVGLEDASPQEQFRTALFGHPLASAQNDPSLSEVLGTQTSLGFLSALSLLHSADPVLAAKVVDRLTLTCTDGDVSFACWIGQGESLAALDLILNRLRSGPKAGTRLADEVRVWLEEQPEWTAWVECDAGPELHIAVLCFLANPRLLTLNARKPGADEPIQVSAKAREITRIEIPRASLQGDGTSLLLGDGVRALRLRLDSPARAVFPPGASLVADQQHWRMEGLRTGTIQRVSGERQVQCTLQRRDSTWQLFIECPAPGSETPEPDGDTPDWIDAADLGQLIGNDLVTFFVGPYLDPLAVFTLDPTGRTKVWRGRVPPDFAARTRALGDGSWRAEIDLPQDWLESNALEVGFIHTTAGLGIVECAPRPCVPWRIDPGRTRYLLDGWKSLSEYD